ncbi:hypothetical protein MMC10_008004 [Thelotrema lepadinum]|nr:hypothetical protein [Thelotrema lepadinum]
MQSSRARPPSPSRFEDLAGLHLDLQARDTVPEVITDEGRRRIWARGEGDRIGIRRLVAARDELGKRWEEVNAVVEARGAAVKVRGELERRWGGVHEVIKARSAGRGERGWVMGGSAGLVDGASRIRGG